MKSIHAQIVAWTLGTLALSTVGFGLTTWWLSVTRLPSQDLIRRLQDFQLQGAREAAREGGPEALGRYLRQLDRSFDARHHLVGSDGVDLLDGRDRSEELSHARVRPWPPVLKPGAVLFASPPDGPRSRLLIEIRPSYRPMEFLPYYLWILPVVAGLGYALSAHLARPLRGLQRTVERFGRGELSARTGSTRRDEIGALSRAFDAMAGRIETLLVAERRLLQDVSHELRSPLARLALAVRLARTSGDRDAALDRVKREVDHLAALVEELLQLTTAEGDPEARRAEDVRLDGLLAVLIDDSTLEAEAKGCRLVPRMDGPQTLRGDANLLRRACENLLRNAIRHAPEGSAVEIDMRRSGDVLTITIRDHGPGVPPGEHEAIFEPFFRVDAGRSRDHGGVGLGLAITRRAVAIHGGQVIAENAHPGLRVTMRFPAPPPTPPA